MHSPAGGHLGRFRFGTITNSVTTNIGGHKYAFPLGI